MTTKLLSKLKRKLYLVSGQNLNLSFVIFSGEGGQLDLLGGQLGHVQGFGQHLDGEVQSVLEAGLVLLVLLLQHGHGGVPVVSNTSGFPTSIVT